MALLSWGKTLMIANPAAHSGDGMAAVDVVDRIISEDGRRTSSFEVLLTKGPGDGRRLAANAAGYDTVIALGGDGIIHEVAPLTSRPECVGDAGQFAIGAHVVIDHHPPFAVADVEALLYHIILSHMIGTPALSIFARKQASGLEGLPSGSLSVSSTNHARRISSSQVRG